MNQALQIRITNELRCCTFLPGSFEKRFVRDIAATLSAGVKSLTEKQIRCLANIFHRYRKQIGSAYETLCLELDPDAFALQFDVTGNATIRPLAKKSKPITTQPALF